MKIGVVAASSRFPAEVRERITAFAAERYPAVELVFHPACHAVSGHFAGEDRARLEALLALANDPAIDALWFGRGGYGSNRIAEAAVERLSPAARNKPFLGYSDAGFVLAALYRAGFPRLFHGPMANDLLRPGGEAAAARALDWLTRGDPAALEPHLDGRPTAAFNLTVLSSLMGTPLEPDLAGHVLMLEDVSEPLYRTDRSLFHLMSQASLRDLAGVRLGRWNDITANDPDFGLSEQQIARFWCDRAGIAFLGEADIGHDADNKVVPFGRSAVPVAR